MHFSVVIPTCGRLSLERSLRSVVPQLCTGDEVIVVTDGVTPGVEDLCSVFPGVRYYEGPETHDCGASQRDLAIEYANCEYLMFLDDDDIYLPGALESARLEVLLERDVAHIFQMRYGTASKSPGLVLWRTPRIAYCDVGTPMFVVPNRQDLPRWAWFNKTMHDYEWIVAVAQRMPVKFHEKVLSIILPGPSEVTL